MTILPQYNCAAANSLPLPKFFAMSKISPTISEFIYTSNSLFPFLSFSVSFPLSFFLPSPSSPFTITPSPASLFLSLLSLSLYNSSPLLLLPVYLQDQ